MSVTSEELWSRLLDHGYRPIRRTPGTALFDRNGDRVIVPDDPGEVPEWIERTLEWELAPSLGSDWLRAPIDDHDGGGVAPPIRVVHALVVRPGGDGRPWEAFVADQPRIAVCGRDEAEVHERARAATALWYDTAPEQVTLVPVAQGRVCTAGSSPTAAPDDPASVATGRPVRTLEPVDG